MALGDPLQGQLGRILSAPLLDAPNVPMPQEFMERTRYQYPPDGCFLEVSAVEPQTREILYLPSRFEFTAEELESWIQADRTTIIDVELLRLPSPEAFKLVS